MLQSIYSGNIWGTQNGVSWWFRSYWDVTLKFLCVSVWFPPDPQIWRWHDTLTLILLTWRIWWAPNNASRWQMGFDSVYRGLKQWEPLNQHSVRSEKIWLDLFLFFLQTTVTLKTLNKLHSIWPLCISSTCFIISFFHCLLVIWNYAYIHMLLMIQIFCDVMLCCLMCMVPAWSLHMKATWSFKSLWTIQLTQNHISGDLNQ